MSAGHSQTISAHGKKLTFEIIMNIIQDIKYT